MSPTSLVLPLIVGVFVTLASKMPVGRAQKELPGGYDNQHPREQQARLEGWGRRALAAHNNAIEAFPLFGVAVVTCLATGVSGPVAAALAWSWVGARIGYNIAYLANIGTLRSSLWALGMLADLGLLGLALLR